MPEHAVSIRQLHKRFGTVEAVNGVDLQVKRGELFGLVGPDGAGKTTLFRTICTLLQPDEGEILVNGKDARRDIFGIRAILGYMPQRFSLYPDLTVEQNLRFFAEIFQVPPAEFARRAEKLYRFSRLEPFKKRKASQLSGGMKQKLALSCALIHTPAVLVLDEPTFGVDPVSREEFWEILNEIRRQGTTILVSTAYMDEADLCDRVGLMHRGKILSHGTPAEVKSRYPYRLYRLEGKNVRELERFFRQVPGVHSTQLFGDAIHVAFEQEPNESDWQRWEEMSGHNVQRWAVQQPSMEDIFMETVESGTA